ncbi:snf 1 [Flagelloscypha sp. PMI_526]|nr:snf 1 [Flagelloscypha sp. PMI_526]
MTAQHQTYQVSQLGEYKIIKDIASGTFGKVKLAEHVVTGQQVAMKFISKEQSKGSGKNRIRKELRYMRELRHPHIIKLYELLSTPKDIIFVLEYAGRELFDYIVDNGRLSEPKGRRFFQQIISGMEYSHRRKIVHRDLKPENLLLDQELNVKIADFGLSSNFSDGSFLDTSCGSPNYAAPEVIKGGSYAGPEIDVWSCGVILYVMLCGKLPFEDEDITSLFHKIAQGQFHMPSYLSPDARDLIGRMLVVDSLKRITIEEITRHPFFVKDLPRYLSPMPLENGPILGAAAALVTPMKAVDYEIIEGLGRIDESLVEELAGKFEDISTDDIWMALRANDGFPGNAIKVAYSMLKDKKMKGQNLASYAEAERDAQLAVLDPRSALSPSAQSPAGSGGEPNPFEAEFNGDLLEGTDDEGERSSDLEDILDGSAGESEPTPQSVALSSSRQPQINNFAVLNSSLPDDQPPPSHPQHHLAAYATQRQRHSHHGEKDRMRRDVYEKKRVKWHFGIRSSSPPMEVMFEIYKTLKALGMEWKEKRNLGGLGGIPPLRERQANGGVNGNGITRDTKLDGEGDLEKKVDSKAASGIYLIEARGRSGDVIVHINIQLYQIEPTSYLVDFMHKKTYRAAVGTRYLTPENASRKFETVTACGPADMGDEEKKGKRGAVDPTVSPFAFMDVATRLILHLAGYEE